MAYSRRKGAQALRPGEKKSDDERREWAAAIIEREQKDGTFGAVTVHLEAGRIIRVSIASTELPPVTSPPKG